MNQLPTSQPASISRLAPTTGSGNLWKVRYDVRFSSSSGMERYHIDHDDQTGYVVTKGESLADVRAVLQASLDRQSQVTALHEAHYMGKVICPNAEVSHRDPTAAAGKQEELTK